MQNKRQDERNCVSIQPQSTHSDLKSVQETIFG